jgi:hypothetical protein
LIGRPSASGRHIDRANNGQSRCRGHSEANKFQIAVSQPRSLLGCLSDCYTLALNRISGRKFGIKMVARVIAETVVESARFPPVRKLRFNTQCILEAAL